MAEGLEGFGFDLPFDEWLGHLREVAGARASALGSLGSYELEGMVGSGGQGVVYRARQRGTGREVALKRLVGGSFATPESRRRFAREIEAAASLHHPGIVAVYGYDEVDGHPLLVMEWVEGVEVTAWARGEAGRLPEPHEVIEMQIAVCEAVQHAHTNGVLHRDLKPSNILVDSESRPRVVDFGLAKRLDVEGSQATRSGAFLGTPEYASPEQFDREATVDARSDVYSLGVILYEMLTGTRPYGEIAEIREYLNALAAESVRRPSLVRPGLGAEIDAILLKCLAYRPEDRYQTVDGLAEDLRRYLRGDAVLAHPPSTWYQIVKIARRNPSAATLAAALVAILAGALAVITWQSRVMAGERDDALVAREAESRANDALRGAQADLTAERERAQHEAERAQAIVDYFLLDVIDQIGIFALGPDATLIEAIDATLPAVAERFRDRPKLESYVRSTIGQVYMHVLRIEDAVEQYELMYELAMASEEPTSLPVAQAKFRVGTGHFAVGNDMAIAVRWLEESTDLALGHDPPASPLAGAAAVYLASLYERIGDYDALERACRRALDALAEQGFDSHWSRYDLTGYLATQLGRRGAYDEAEALVNETLAHAREHSPREASMALLIQKGGLDATLGRHEEAVATFTEIIDFYTETAGPDDLLLVGPLGRLALSLLELERLDEAEEAAWRARAIVGDRRDSEAANALTILGEIRSRRGAFEEARDLLLEAHRLRDGIGRSGSSMVVRTDQLLAAACLELGEPEEALAHGARALDGLQRLHGPAHRKSAAARGILFRACAALGRDAEADEHARAHVALLAECASGDAAECTRLLRGYAAWWEERGDAQDAARSAAAAEALGTDG